MNRDNWQQIYFDIVTSLRIHKQGGLMVLSSGINSSDIISLLLSFFLERSKNVIVLLNFDEKEIEYMDLQIGLFALVNQLNNNKELCLQINNLTKLIADKRGVFYKQGGIFTLSNQIFMQDLLNNVLTPFSITHLIIGQAHTITSRYDYECWITNFIKRSKPDIFTLALTNQSSILAYKQNIQTILRCLYIDQVMPWPINRVEVVKNLKNQALKWQEFRLSMPVKCKEMQESILNLIDLCVQDVNSKSQSSVLTSDMIIKMSEAKLKAVIQKQAVRIDIVRYQQFLDLFQLRKLLFQLIYMSPMQFFNNLETIVNEASIDSVWYITHPGIEKNVRELQSQARSRAYQIVQTDQPINYQYKDMEKKLKLKIIFQINLHPKLSKLFGMISEIQSLSSERVQRIWVWVRNKSSVSYYQQQINAYYRMNDKVNALNQFNYLRMNLQNFEYKEQQAPISQTKKPTIILKHNKNKIKQIQNNYQDEQYITGVLKQELDAFYQQIFKQRESILLQQQINYKQQKQYTYQDKQLDYLLLQNNLLDIDIRQSIERIDEQGNFIKFDDDNTVPNCVLSVNSLETDCQRMQFREQFKPDHIILAEPNHQMLKELLISGSNAKVYLLIQEESIESWMYLQQKLDEELAFEQILQEQSNFVKNFELPEDAIKQHVLELSTRQGRGQQFFDEQNLKPRVIVDYREFRCDVPPKLYFSGFHITPVMLKIGDVVLSNNCVIERKCVETGDFFDSIMNSRLEDQLRRLNQFEYPFLLIEYSENIPFSLQSLYRIAGQANNSRIMIRLLELVQKYQRIQILWSKNSDDTINIIKRLKCSLAKTSPDVSNFKGKDQQSQAQQQQKITNYFSSLDQLIDQ